MCHDLGPLPSSTPFPPPPAACGPVLHPLGPVVALPGAGLPRPAGVEVTPLWMKFEVTES